MDYAAVASQFLRALRGKRSQTALSRRLGYRSNVVYMWESGGGFPTAARAFEVARRVGVDPDAAVARFYGRQPEWLQDTSLTEAQGVAAFLRDLRGRQALSTLAPLVGRDRYALSRWYKGLAEPRLPDFLKVVEVSSLRLLDFLNAFVDLDALPAVAEAGRRLAAARRIAREAPWSHAVLRALELANYRELPSHERGWIAARVGISQGEEDQCLQSLAAAGQIAWVNERWRPQTATTLDLRRDQRAAQELAIWCARLGVDRLTSGASGAFAFNVFSVSSEDLERLRQLQREYFGQLRAIIADSEPAERLVVVNLQLFELGMTDPDDPHPSRESSPPQRTPSPKEGVPT